MTIHNRGYRAAPETADPGEFSRKLVELMEARDIGQAELAREIGVHKGMVNTWVSSRHYPTLENLMKVAKALAVPLTHFAEDEDRELAQCFSDLDADIWRIVRTLGADEAYRRLLQAPPTK